MLRLSVEERAGVRAYLRRRGRVPLGRVPVRHRRTAHAATAFLDALGIPKDARPRILPISTRQRVSESVRKRGPPTLVLFDYGHVDALYWIVGLIKRRERGAFLQGQLMIRAAEAALLAGDRAGAVAVSAAALEALKKAADEDGNIARPQTYYALDPLTDAYMPDVPRLTMDSAVEEALRRMKAEDLALLDLVSAFVLGHEIGHSLPLEGAEEIRRAIQDMSGVFGAQGRLFDPSAGFDFGPDGEVLKSRTMGSRAKDIFVRHLNNLSAEYLADYLGILLLTDRVRDVGFAPDFTLRHGILPTLIGMEADALMRRLARMVPRRGAGGTVTFDVSPTRGRIAMVFQILGAIRDGTLWAPEPTRAYWAGAEGDLSLDGAAPFEHALATLEEIQRRAILEAIVPVLPDYETTAAAYPPEMRAGLANIRPLSVDAQFFDPEELEAVRGRAPLTMPLVALAQGALGAASALWEVGGDHSAAVEDVADADLWARLQEPGLAIMRRAVPSPGAG